MIGFTQNQIIRIVDEQNQALVGVNVHTLDNVYQAISNESGQIVIGDQIPPETKLLFSYLGYQSLTIRRSNLTELVQMRPLVSDLDLVLIVGRRDERSDEIPFKVERIDQSKIELNNPQTTVDMLGQEGTVFVQKSQLGGGSPIIRGFEANRVLLVVDGVRMNNAIYRSGHLQNAITIDPAVLEQMEVVYGPGSLVYGSDALGGVVHFRTREPEILRPKDGEKKRTRFSSNYYMRYAGANGERSAHYDLNIGTRRWAFLTSMSASSFGDLRAGSRRPDEYPDFGKRFQYVDRQNGEDVVLENEDPNVQTGTAYNQIDLLQKIRFQPGDSLYFTANFQFSNSSDIPRYDRLTERRNDQLRFAEWHYGPQQRLLGSLKARILKPSAWYDRATLIGAYQRIDEDRFERRLFSNWRETNLADVRVFTFTADFDKYLGADRRNRLAYGFDGSHNEVVSQAWREDISNETRIFDVNTRYPSQGSRLTAGGAYLNYHWKNLDGRFNLHGGLRYSFTRLHAVFGANDPIKWPTFYLDGIANTNAAFNWALGMTYNSPGLWQFRLLSASAFRAPNVDDFGKFRENDGFVLVPNPNLEPEKSVNLEASLAKTFLEKDEFWRLKVSATAFYTRLRNAIVRENFQLPDGASSFISQSDTFFVQTNINADQARIYGLSGNLQLSIGKNWRLLSGLNFTKGRRALQQSDIGGGMSIDTLVPMDHIPPMYGRTSLQYQFGDLRFEAALRYNSRKKASEYAISSYRYDANCGLRAEREGTADNIEQGVITNPADPCDSPFLGVYGWTTLNFYVSYGLNSLFTLNLGMENITDIHYRSFASGLSAPGRNIILAFRGQF